MIRSRIENQLFDKQYLIDVYTSLKSVSMFIFKMILHLKCDFVLSKQCFIAKFIVGCVTDIAFSLDHRTLRMTCEFFVNYEVTITLKCIKWHKSRAKNQNNNNNSTKRYKRVHIQPSHINKWASLTVSVFFYSSNDCKSKQMIVLFLSYICVKIALVDYFKYLGC